MGPLQTKELFLILCVLMHKVPYVERSDLKSIFGCYFVHSYSEGTKDSFAAQSSVQGQVLGLERRNKVLNLLKNTLN